MKLINCHHIRKRRRRRRRRTEFAGKLATRTSIRTRTRTRTRTSNSRQYLNDLLKKSVNEEENESNNSSDNNYDDQVATIYRTVCNCNKECDRKELISSKRRQIIENHIAHHDDAIESSINAIQRVACVPLPIMKTTSGGKSSVCKPKSSSSSNSSRLTISFKLLYLTLMCLVVLDDNVDLIVDKFSDLQHGHCASEPSDNLCAQLAIQTATTATATNIDQLRDIKSIRTTTATTCDNLMQGQTLEASQGKCSNQLVIKDQIIQDVNQKTSARLQRRRRSWLKAFVWVQFVGADSDANRLYEDLMMTYNRIVRPVQNESDRVVVRMGLKLSQLMEVNLKNQMMTINVWLNQEWSDYKLKWDPSEYGGIEEINLPAEQIWLPDIVLYNSAEGYFAVSIMTKAKVRYDGYVIWNPPAIFRSSCQIDITYFPFDSQNCHLKFGSWTFGTKLDLRHINDTEGTIERGTDLSEYYQNVEWDIMQASARRNTIVYDCCPNDIYPDVTFNFTLRRKPLFFTVNLIVPCVFLTFFSFLVFYLPSDSGEKVTLTISILVSLIFFLSILIETIPSTSLAMPLLGKYLVFTMILITLSVCATVCVLNIHFRSPSTHTMPPWVKHWCMDVLPKYLFMSVPQYQSQQSNILPENLVYAHNQAYTNQVVSLPSKPSTRLSQTAQTNLCGGETKLNSSNSTKGYQYHDNQIVQQNSLVGHAAKGEQMSTDGMSQTADNLNYKPNKSDARPLKLDVANLASSASVFQGRSSSFLPYLHSEAARRLQMQRSRSSERDNRSASDNQQASGSTSEDQSNQKSKNATRRQDTAQSLLQNNSSVVNVSSSSKIVEEQSKPKVSSKPFWRIFKSTRSNSSNGQDSKIGSQQINIRRPSHESESSTSSTSAHMPDDDDNYLHHRHFQARASICSNNLWRIGPTRRCSLATPVNYPTYYRPLAQLQVPHDHRDSSGQLISSTINGNLQITPGTHYHNHRDDSVGSSVSTDTYNYQSGATVVSLITAAASHLLSPRQFFDQPHEARYQEEREMQPLTSGGYIKTGAQLPHAVGAVPPRQSDTPSSYQSGSQYNVPTPPPPLPPEFGDAQSNNYQVNSNYAHMPSRQGHIETQIYQQSIPSNSRPCQFNTLSRQAHIMPKLATTNFSATTAASPHGGQYATSTPSAQHASRINQSFAANKALIGEIGNLNAQTQQRNHRVMNFARGPSHNFNSDSFNQQFVAGPMSTNHSVANNIQAMQYLHCSQPMSRSRSTGHQLSSMAHEMSTIRTVPYQANNNANQIDQKNAQVYQISRHSMNQKPLIHGYHQSIGRQLGQAYIQKLQRQPTVTSLNLNRGLPMPPLCGQIPSGCTPHKPMLTDTHLRTQRSIHSGYQLGQYHEPTIDMLRRSKSQTSLNRRAHSFYPITDCQHCLASSADYRDTQNCGTTNDARLTYRPHSEMRGRVNSTGCRFDSNACRTSNYSGRKNCDDEASETFPCIGSCSPAMAASIKTMPTQTSKNQIHSNDNSACRCSAMDRSASGATSQPNANQLSSLSMLKLISEVDKAIQNAMFIAQHIDNSDEFESVKETWKYIAMVIDRIFLIIFLFACIFGTVAIFALIPWSYYLNEKPIDLHMTRLLALNLTNGETFAQGCREF